MSHSVPVQLKFGTKVEETEANPCKLCKEIRLCPKEMEAIRQLKAGCHIAR